MQSCCFVSSFSDALLWAAFDLTCVHWCTVKECHGPGGMTFVSFRTASQFLTSMVDYGVCNMPGLDSEQRPDSTGIERPLAGRLEKAAGTIKARVKQRTGLGRFSSCVQQLNEFRNWFQRLGLETVSTLTSSHPSCSREVLCPLGFDRYSKCLIFLLQECWWWGWV